MRFICTKVFFSRMSPWKLPQCHAPMEIKTCLHVVNYETRHASPNFKKCARKCLWNMLLNSSFCYLCRGHKDTANTIWTIYIYTIKKQALRIWNIFLIGFSHINYYLSWWYDSVWVFTDKWFWYFQISKRSWKEIHLGLSNFV